MARRRRSTVAAVVAGIGTLAGVLGTVAAVDGTDAALVVLVFFMFCMTVAALSAVIVHLADRMEDPSPGRRASIHRQAGSGRPRRGEITSSARTKGDRR